MVDVNLDDLRLFSGMSALGTLPVVVRESISDFAEPLVMQGKLIQVT